VPHGTNFPLQASSHCLPSLLPFPILFKKAGAESALALPRARALSRLAPTALAHSSQPTIDARPLTSRFLLPGWVFDFVPFISRTQTFLFLQLRVLVKLLGKGCK